MSPIHMRLIAGAASMPNWRLRTFDAIGAGRAVGRSPVLARQDTWAYTQPSPIEIPIPHGFCETLVIRVGYNWKFQARMLSDDTRQA